MKDQSKTNQARSESERRKVEQALKESEESGWTILENIQEGYYEVDLAGNYTFFNSSMSKILGYSKEEMMGMNYRLYMDIETTKKIFRFFNKVYRTGISSKVDYEQIKKDGSTMYVATSVALMRDSFGQPTGFRGIVRDITERKRAEETLQRAHDELEQRVADRTEELIRVNYELRANITDRKQTEEALRESAAQYRLLAEHMTDIVWMMDLDLNVTWLSPSAMKARGFSVDEISALPLDRQLTPESLGKAVNWLGKLMRLEKEGRNSEPDGILSRELEFYCKGGHTIWLDCSLQFIRDEQGKATGILAEGKDITARKRVDKELLRTIENLRKAVNTTIQVMVSAVETRDPYTAGHQIRSADLARAIATEIGLSPEKIEGIRMAGSIHDIGKLSIPAEILSKPTKLSELEFSLIKEHTQKGFEMLKDVESPWPLAEIVYQHHERMDGSGYPRHLKGEEILIEARILAVADVVEAMASHRPYRPGLGIDAALNEIEKNRGICYDDAVADACLRLFREKGFKLEGLDYKQ